MIDMTKENRVILTDETKTGKMTEADEALLSGTGPFKRIKSVEEFQRLAKMARRVYDEAEVEAEQFVTPALAARIRQLRCEEGYTWRAIALDVYHELDTKGEVPNWSPPSNQLAGMALCKIAADLLGEDANKDPWN